MPLPTGKELIGHFRITGRKPAALVYDDGECACALGVSMLAAGKPPEQLNVLRIAYEAAKLFGEEAYTIQSYERGVLDCASGYEPGTRPHCDRDYVAGAYEAGYEAWREVMAEFPDETTVP